MAEVNGRRRCVVRVSDQSSRNIVAFRAGGGQRARCACAMADNVNEREKEKKRCDENLVRVNFPRDRPGGSFNLWAIPVSHTLC